jgi:hypothetical protein
MKFMLDVPHREKPGSRVAKQGQDGLTRGGFSAAC